MSLINPDANHDFRFTQLCRRFDDSLEFPELKVTKEGALLRQLVNEYGFSKILIQMFDHWLDHVLPRQIMARRMERENGYFEFRLDSIKRPTAQLYPETANQSSGTVERELYPHRSRELNYTYSVKLRIQSIFHPKNPKPNEKPSIDYIEPEIPIMLGCKYCWLSGMTDAQKIAVGECPNDPLGYIIVKGTEKNITIQDKLRLSIPFVFKGTKGELEERITCATPTGTTLVRLILGKKRQSIKMWLPSRPGSIKKKDIKVPCFVIFAFFLVTPDEYESLEGEERTAAIRRAMKMAIDAFILPRCVEKHRLNVELALQPALAKAYDRAENIVEYFMGKIGQRIPDGVSTVQAYRNIYTDLSHDLFPHVAQVEGAYPNLYKAHHLAQMILNFELYLLGARELDDRDSSANKRFETAARSMEQLFNQVWNQVTSIEPKPTARKSGIDNMATIITSTFEKSTSEPNAWGLEGAYAHQKENIVDTLKRETPMAVYSQIGRINTPSPREIKQSAIRMIHPTQIGYVCPAETPEGEGCGLLKNMTIVGCISLERPTDDILSITKDPSLENYVLSHTPFDDGTLLIRDEPDIRDGQPLRKCEKGTLTPFYVNGAFVCWIAPVEGQTKDILGRKRLLFEEYLSTLKRQGYLPYDVCIFYNRVDRILEYFCDGSRPVRPLLVVDDDGQLVIDKPVMDEQGNQVLENLWGQPTAVLLQKGAIEFIDAREQEFIMLAMFPDDVRDRVIAKKQYADLVATFTDEALDGHRLALESSVSQLIGSPEFATSVRDLAIDLFKYHNAIALATNKPFDEATYFKRLQQLRLVFVGVFLQTAARSRLRGMNEASESFKNQGFFAARKEIESFKMADNINVVKFLREVNASDVDTVLLRFVAPELPLVDLARRSIEGAAKEISDANARLNSPESSLLPYSHSEIDPLAILGTAGSLEPQPNCGQGPRATYQASMCKQALSVYHYNHHLRFDTSFKVMLNPSRPLFETIIGEPSGLNTAPSGTTPICAVMAMRDNNEDAIVAKKEYLEGLDLEIVKYTTHKCIAKRVALGEQFKLPKLRKGESASRYEHINEFGLPKLDSYIRQGDCIIGKVRVVGGIEQNASLFAGVGEDGYVDRILIAKSKSQANQSIVKVKVRQIRKHISGDKLASRYAQKGTLSRIIPEKDLPRVVGGVNDGLVPDFFLNPHCFPGETPIDTFTGVARRIDSFPTEGGLQVLSFDGKGFVPKTQNTLMSNGVKKLIQLTMMDGRTIRVTPNHPFKCLLSNGVIGWVRAGHLPAAITRKVSKDRELEESSVYFDAEGGIIQNVHPLPEGPVRVLMGLDMPLDVPLTDEIGWSLTTGDYTFTMETEEEREKSLAFARLLGAVLTDGTVCERKDGDYLVNVCIGHQLDADAALRDIELLTGKRPTVSPSYRNGVAGGYIIVLPSRLGRAIAALPDVRSGRRVEHLPTSYPSFLFTAPIAIIREFLGGLFGGDGWTSSLCLQRAENTKGSQDRLTFPYSVAFSQSIIETYQNEMVEKMNGLIVLLDRVGVKDVRMMAPKKPSEQISLNGPRNARKQAGEDVEGHPDIERVVCGVSIPTTSDFATYVGFRYCVQKSCRLSAATAYFRYLENVKRQHDAMIEATNRYFNTRQATTINGALELARADVFQNESPLNEHYSLLNRDIVNNRRRRDRQHNLDRLDFRFIADAEAFMRYLGVIDWFRTEDGDGFPDYIVKRGDNHIPHFTMDVVDIRDSGEEEVFDISVKGLAVFTTKGICVSNSQPSRMTMGVPKEILSSRAALYAGERVDASCFHKFDIAQYQTILENYGMDRFGEEKMMWPDGTTLQDEIFIGPIFYQCLRHHVLDKIQMRSRGAIKPMTHQPVGGRSNEGGLRVGEMERDAFISHGATDILRERLMLVSDPYRTVFCKTCGNIAIADHNSKAKKISCRLCGSDTGFVTANFPYVFKLIIFMLNAMQINVSIKFDPSIDRNTLPENRLLQ